MTSKKHLIILILFFSNVLISCAQSSDNHSPFSTPKEKWVMPTKLEEISGLAWHSENTLACVNDEKGNIYLYDLVKKEVTKKIKFGKDADYEGITYRAPYFYVISSKGKLHIVNEKTQEVTKIQLPFTIDNDIEGLCFYDQSHLLVALKGKGGINGEKADYKAIYKVNMEDYNDVSLAFTLPKGNKLSPSAVYFDQSKQLVYVLSHRSGELFIINATSKEIINTHNLPRKNFPQPEGICISPNGRLFISTEKGDQFSARILEF
ncbi:SdiA-regulated domain-containing protein [Flammeovirga kamogawensis]|uniref:SdiA-regulated domain-containing protein n=1 Tax=Flammeovirga kamogawensis TaxID=373891 RepID=A0ABX8H109_9BACT|nr:SdiA-regulated domain-containing protein [Flammeovirga kamogawensis]MBB6463279.1 uncharacterized protein YjiK [Flammeovirga kamogawensis]QWG09571.1 SdiA-regulated domain-containing protein [Flammeovirga kamogawensis]TRX65085.1 hypothetical protein EO216_21365 [Flammeovirga kamogawensis]